MRSRYGRPLKLAQHRSGKRGDRTCTLPRLGIRRVYNVSGRIHGRPDPDLLNGPPDEWMDTLASFADDLGFDTFIFWPEGEPLDQLERFAEEVVPALRR